MTTAMPRVYDEAVVACIHHAGGTTACFAGWSVPEARLELLGYRGARHGSLADLAATMAEGLAQFGSGGVVLYGHSMGAVLAYEAALLLERAGLPPAAVVLAASASPDPMRRPRAVPRPGLPAASGRRAAEVLEADLALLDAYGGREAAREHSLAAPVLLVAADDDEVVAARDVWDWERWCLTRPERLLVTGGHLFHRRSRALPAAIARYVPARAA
ncbi:alpha/beta fold hydrolase [Sinomonas sp. ASV322]|uniref:thioesterase II family protein n=1 Tax=Sinomonas sp. ASV322 TaxID=3041920 RepID=UPI0027DEA6A4|nr:alpha/beta fold hydrolase [Sinomonas sp. ASV322]MDQ4504037.1 alpha/beta fold hydrolase [Sinomonas sp. ASV322]